MRPTAVHPKPPPPASPPGHSSPITSALLLGLGLGGFFDGIVLHQILQWHPMVSSFHAPETLGNLQLNTLTDGLFHAATYGFVAVGLWSLWRHAHQSGFRMPGAVLAGGLLAGFGTFDLVEGVVNHHLLRLHHVNETVPTRQWIWWDLGFLASGAAMLLAGVLLLRQDRKVQARRRA